MVYKESKFRITRQSEVAMKNSMRISILLSLILFSANLSFSTIIDIPGDYSTIQEGINVSVNGDTVLVAIGSYDEIINLNGKRILLGSNFIFSQDTMDIHNTVIGSDGNASVILTTGEDTTTVLNGFKIISANIGVQIDSSSAKLKNLILPSLLGVNCSNSSFTNYEKLIIEGCQFQNCSLAVNIHNSINCFIDNCLITGEARTTTGILMSNWEGDPPVLYVFNSHFNSHEVAILNNNYQGTLEYCTIDSCLFNDNEKSIVGYCKVINGSVISNGSIAFLSCEDLPCIHYQTIENSVIENITDTVFNRFVDVAATGCNIRYNSGKIIGDAGNDYARISFINCHISGNSGLSISPFAIPARFEMIGCVYDSNYAPISPVGGMLKNINNCTITRNIGGGIIVSSYSPLNISNTIIAYNHGVGIMDSDAEPVAISCCDLFGNDSGNYVGIQSPFDSNGNFSANPLFCDISNSDFEIHACSPCAPGNNDCDTLIGAFGVGCGHCGPVWYVDDDNTSGPWDGSYEFPFISIQKAIDSSNTSDTVIVLPGQYTEQIVMAQKSLILMVADSTKSSPVSLVAVPNRRVITVVDAPDTVKIIGFDISGGESQNDTLHNSGGGILVYNSPAVIENCTIHNNTATGGSGGGICFRNNSYAELRGNTIYNNEASWGGGIMASANSTGGILDSNVVYGNNSIWEGGGIFLYNSSYTGTQYSVNNNTIAYNDGTYLGTGLSAARINLIGNRNIVAHNCATDSVGIENTANVGFEDCNSVVWECNDVYGVCNLYRPDTITIDTSNIPEDPGFCNSDSGNFHINSSSPCLPENNGCNVLIGALGEGCSAYTGPVWYVDDDNSSGPWDGSFEYPFLTIQEGVDSAKIGDTVMIMPGEYVGATILGYEYDGHPSTSSIYIIGYGAADSIIINESPDYYMDEYGYFILSDNDNITISNLSMAGDVSEGCITIHSTSNIEINNCRIYGGHSKGILVYNSDSVFITDNYIADRHWNYYTSTVRGCGIGVENGSLDTAYIEISNNLIENNTISLEGYAYGAGIYCVSEHFMIKGNIIRNNYITGTPFLYGGGLCCIGAGTISDNLITGNYIDGHPHYDQGLLSKGGGLYADNSTGIDTLMIKNNTIDGNYCRLNYPNNQEEEIYGGGIYLVSGGIYSIDHNLICSNQCYADNANDTSYYTSNGGGIYCTEPIEIISANDIWGNEPNDYNASINPLPSEYNISLNPRLCSDYYLAANSPCINIDSTGTDAGAFQGNYCDSLFLTIYVDSAAVDTTQHGTESLPYAHIQTGIDASQSGDTVLVMPGTYFESDISTQGKAILLKSEQGSDSTTIVPGADNNGFYLYLTGEIATTIIDGFKLANSNIGIFLCQSSPSIKNMVIESTETAFYCVTPVSYMDTTFCTNININQCQNGFYIMDYYLCSIINSELLGINRTGKGIETGYGSVVYLKNTDVGGWATGGSAGFFTGSSQLIIDSCDFYDNDLALYAANAYNSTIRDGNRGMLMRSATDCIYENLTGPVFATGYHAAIDINGCLVRNNTGDIFNNPLEEASAFFTDCQFSGNSGGITASGDICDFHIVNCLYINNDAPISLIGGTCEICEEDMIISGCTISNNTSTAIDASQRAAALYIYNNIISYNNGMGLLILDYGPSEVTCNNVFANTEGDYDSIPEQPGENGNISEDPHFCDTTNADFYLAANSPCLPENNACDTLIGALDMGCGACGDASGDDIVNIFDITYLISYLYLEGPAPDPMELADVNNDGAINIFDITYLISYLYLDGPEPDCP